MNTFLYNNIFTEYSSKEGKKFNLLAKSINLPEDEDNELYSKIYIDRDIAWTMLSYQIYGTIHLWWILCLLNKTDIFYAKAESEVRFIKQEYVDVVIEEIQNQIN